MAKVLSFEVGQGTTKVVEMDYKSKNPKIYNMFTLETPEDVVQDGVIARNEEFIVAVKTEIRRRMIKTTQAVFTVASGRIANREARIPFCKPNKIMQLVTANASDYFPVDMNQYHLVYNILGEATAEDGAKQYRLSLLAVPNDVTTSYIDFARSLELDIKAIDYVGNSIFQAVKEDVAGTTTAFLKVEEHASLITIVHQGEILLQRQIAHGLNQAIMNLMESDMYQDEELTYAGASRKFIENKIIRPHLNLDAGVSAEDANEEDLMVRVMITESLRYLCGNMGRVIEYFVSRNEDKPLNNIYLVGLGADFQGLPELLSNELGVDIRVYEGLNKYSAINVDPNAPSVSMNQMIGPIGAATAPLQLLSADLLKEEKDINLLIPGIFMVAGIAAAIVMIIAGKIMVTTAQNETKKKEEELAGYDYVAKIVEDYDNSTITYQALKDELVKADNWNNELVAFIEEMEKKMPTDFVAMNFNVSTSGIEVACQVKNKEEAARVIEQFRTFKSVALIQSSSFKEGVIESGNAEVLDADGNIIESEIKSEEDQDKDQNKTVSFILNLAYTDWASRNATAEEAADTPTE